MKAITYFTCIALMILATACGDTFSDYEGDYEEGYYEDEYGQGYSEEGYGAYDEQGAYQEPGMNQSNRMQQTRGNGKVVMHNLIGQQTGVVTGRLPLPANWKVSAGQMTGPGGTVVQEYQGAPIQGQFFRMDQLINSRFDQFIREKGGQMTGTIDLPEVSQCDNRQYAQYWKAMPSQDNWEAKGIEFKAAGGKRGLVVVHLLTSQSQYGNFQSYYFGELIASPSRYEQAKKDYLYGIARMEHDPQYLAAYNRSEQQKSNQSWAQHNHRMKQNQINFNNSQQPYQTGNDVSDIMHEGWKRRNDMNNAGHDKTINGITGQQTMTNPYSGQPVNVQSGYNNYYMNNSGEYIGTDDQFYNPNMDPNINNQDWQQLENYDDKY